MKRVTFGFLAIALLLAAVVLNSDASSIVQQAYNLIQDEASNLTRRSTLNFTGAGVTCTDDAGKARTDCDIPGGVGSGYDTIEEDGTPLTQRTTVNFTGAGVTCADDGGTMTTECDIPSAGGSGLVPTGTFYATDDGGTTFYGPIYSVTPPNTVSFSWRNQGGATETATGSGLFLTAPLGAGENIRGREITAPGTPYTITVLFSHQTYSVNFNTCGLYIADNGTGRIQQFSLGTATTSIGISNYTNATTFSSTVQSAGLTASNIWMRVSDNGTNLTYSWSRDGSDFTQFYTAGRTTWTASPDRVGYFCNANNATYPASVVLLSWRQT